MIISGFRKALLELASPVLRRMSPWWAVRLYHRLSGNPFSQNGYSDFSRVVCLRPHQYWIELNLNDWSERLAYYCSHYYDIEGCSIIEKFMKQGDTFIDVGANIGFLTLTAAKVVGPHGNVLAFEPNPTLADRLRSTCSNNNLGQVTVYEIALGHEDGEGVLELTAHSGTATMRGKQPIENTQHSAIVKIRRGDDLVSPPIGSSGLVFLKVDVEGFEYHVLSGFKSLLSTGLTALLVEVTDAWLRQTSSSAESLFSFVHGLSMQGFLVKTNPFNKPTLTPLNKPQDGSFQYDVLFLPMHGEWQERFIAAARNSIIKIDTN